MKTNLFWLLPIVICLPIFCPPLALAQRFTSDTYIIEWGNFNVTSGRKSSANYQLTDTIGQMAPGQYDSAGFTIKSGFQYIYDTFNQFSFSIDDLAIEFGALVPGIGVTDSNIITISTPSGNGYQIMAHQNHPLRLSTGTTIPDTGCDDLDCTESVSGTWTQDDVYGFGFNALGIDEDGAVTNVGTSQFFGNISSYRQFADYSANPPESSQIIMEENQSVSDHSARITYKVNISSAQAAGDYQNAIIFTAIPKY